MAPRPEALLSAAFVCVGERLHLGIICVGGLAQHFEREVDLLHLRNGVGFACHSRCHQMDRHCDALIVVGAVREVSFQILVYDAGVHVFACSLKGLQLAHQLLVMVSRAIGQRGRNQAGGSGQQGGKFQAHKSSGKAWVGRI